MGFFQPTNPSPSKSITDVVLPPEKMVLTYFEARDQQRQASKQVPWVDGTKKHAGKTRPAFEG